MAKPVKYRKIHETTNYYPSQIERAEMLCLKFGLTRAKLMRLALEAYLRHFGLVDPDLPFLTDDIAKKKLAEYKDEFIRPFVEVMREHGQENDKEV